MNGEFRVKRLRPFAMLPTRGDIGAIGFDLYACGKMNDRETWALMPGQRGMFGTGNAFQIPSGFYGQIAARSGLASEFGAQVLGGVVDPSYRGEVKVMLYNSGADAFTIKHGMRIAQIILIRAVTPALVEVDELDETTRGDGGFGSTGRF